ncbi:hypothetical protein evm_007733 [Chilo suppressalis]|nr:hypothetical protein evm_007733 [Chilo suppressalis]
MMRPYPFGPYPSVMEPSTGVAIIIFIVKSSTSITGILHSINNSRHYSRSCESVVNTVTALRFQSLEK